MKHLVRIIVAAMVSGFVSLGCQAVIRYYDYEVVMVNLSKETVVESRILERSGRYSYGGGVKGQARFPKPGRCQNLPLLSFQRRILTLTIVTGRNNIQHLVCPTPLS